MSPVIKEQSYFAQPHKHLTSNLIPHRSKQYWWLDDHYRLKKAWTWHNKHYCTPGKKKRKHPSLPIMATCPCHNSHLLLSTPQVAVVERFNGANEYHFADELMFISGLCSITFLKLLLLSWRNLVMSCRLWVFKNNEKLYWIPSYPRKVVVVAHNR